MGLVICAFEHDPKENEDLLLYGGLGIQVVTA